MNIQIRLETPADYRAVEELTREAFWRFWEPDQTICNEHLLVHRLRSAPSLVPELDLVAEYDGKLAGHIIYTRSRVTDDADNTFETLTFGPLSVLPELQNKGIGQELMRYSFSEARRLGYRAVFIFGHPDYYPRAGFRRASEFGVTTADGQTFDPPMNIFDFHTDEAVLIGKDYWDTLGGIGCYETVLKIAKEVGAETRKILEKLR